MEKEEVIKKRDELRDVLETKNKDIKVGKIVYYEDFEILPEDDKHAKFSEDKVFVVRRSVQQDGLSLEYYEMYNEDFGLIGRTDENGEIAFDKQFLDKLKKTSPELYKKLGFEERKAFLNKENEFTVNNNSKENLTEKEINSNTIKENEYAEKKVDLQEPAIIGEDLGIDKHSITYCVEIKDDRFFDSVPESKEFSKTAMLIYSTKIGGFMVVGMKDGKIQPYQTIDTAKTSRESSIDLDEDGSDIERDTIEYTMRIKGNNDYSLSIDYEPGGVIEFQQLRRDNVTGEYVSSDLQTSLQYKSTKEVEDIMKLNRNKEIRDEVERFREAEDKEDDIEISDIKETKDKEIDDEEYQKVPWDNPRHR